MKISAVIITKNEEANIERCLNSLTSVSDEIVVVDTFSTDKTEEICRAFGANFVQRKWNGYAEAKNFGNQTASNQWILSLDGDEELTAELIKEIDQLKSITPIASSFSFNRLSNYCGHWVKHGGWFPDWKIRLFNKTSARWVDRKVHEFLEVDNPAAVVKLNGLLNHYTYNSKEDHLSRLEKYTDLEVEQLRLQGKSSNYFKLIFSPIVKFINDYIIKGGFLDGKAGYNIARISAYGRYLRYWKMMREK